MDSSFIYFLSFLVLGIPLCTAQTQTMTFYKTPNCTGVPIKTMNSSETYTIPGNGNVSSISYMGLWTVRQDPTAAQTPIYSGWETGQCARYFPPLNGTIQVRMYGDSAMKNSSSITFHTLKNFGGTEYSITSNMSNVEYNMKSCWFTGANSTWVLFTGANYTGTATCLTPSNTVKQSGWGHTFEYDRSINIRSIIKVSACPRGNDGSSNSSFFSTPWNTGLLALLSMAVFNEQSF